MKNFDIYYDHDFFPNKIYFVLIRLSLSKRLRVKKKSEIMISEKKKLKQLMQYKREQRAKKINKS